MPHSSMNLSNITPEAFVNTELNLVTYSKFCPNGVEKLTPILRLNLHYEFHNAYTSMNKAVQNFFMNRPAALVVAISLGDLIYWFRFFALKDLIRLAKIHGVTYRSKNKKDLTDLLFNHRCSPFCGHAHIVLFKDLPYPRVTALSVAPTSLASSASDGNATTARETDKRRDGAPSLGETPADTGHFDHLSPLTQQEILKFAKNWEEQTSTHALKLVVCASCAKRVTDGDSLLKESKNINLSLLTNPEVAEIVRPSQYDFNAYQNAFLSHNGLESVHERGRMRLCYPCYSALESGRMPKFALANHLYSGHSELPLHAKQAFSESTLFERMLISRARVNRICCQFRGTNGDSEDRNGHSTDPILAGARRGVRGNVVVVPLDTIRMNSVIPPNKSSIKDTMCAMFISDVLPSKKALVERKLRPVLVRKSRVKVMIEFLLAYNPQYMPVKGGFNFSQENLDNLFDSEEDEGVPASVEIGHINPNNCIAASTADYTPRNNDYEVVSVSEEDLLMENVGYTDGDTSTASRDAMKALALERSLMGKPFVASRAGNRLISDFENPSILSWLFPHLDPWGITGFFHINRRIKLTLEEQLSHFLMVDNNIFERDSEFAFVFYNVVRKMQVSRSIRFSVSPSLHRRLTREMMSIDPIILLNLGKKFASNAAYKPSTEIEKKAMQIMTSIGMVARNIPGSNGHKSVMRNEIRALINFKGTPTLFVTLNPSDVDNPIVRLLAGQDISLEAMPNIEDMDSWRRRIFAAQHPAACALFFDAMIKKFITVLLKYDSRHVERGLFGVCSAYYGTVEAQGKGTLHCHMLIWLDGHLPPQKLRDAMSQSSEYRDRVFKWVESIIKCEFPIMHPQDPAFGPLCSQPQSRIRHGALGTLHPGTIPAPHTSLVAKKGASAYWTAFNDFLTRLLHEYNWHIHNATCWKYLRKGEAETDKNCRLRMNGITRAETSLEDETGALLLRRHHPRIAAYNELITVLLKSNTEIKYIGSGRAARDLVFYITDYVTKPSLPLHAGMAALQYAIKKVGEKMASNMDGYTTELNTSAIITAVNSMMGRQEISHPQVMSYLIGGGDHYTSHSFCTLNWTQILAFVERFYRISDDSTSIIGSRTDEHNMSLDVRKDSVTASCQHLDYIFRSKDPAFDNLCLYDFCSTTSKEAIPRAVREAKDIDSIPGTFCDWEHPQRSTHRLKLRQHSQVPVLLGPTIPNPEQSSALRDIWAKYVLILFKPWRSALDLRGTHNSWVDAYTGYKPLLKDTHRQIIENMNAFSESMDARAALLHRSHENDVSPDDINMRSDGVPVDSEAFDPEDQLAMPHNPTDAEAIDDVYMFTESGFPYAELLDTRIEEKVGSRMLSKLYAVDGPLPMPNSVIPAKRRMTEAQEEDTDRLEEYQDIMKRQKTLHRLPQNADEDGLSPMAHMYRHLREPESSIMVLNKTDQMYLSSDTLLKTTANSIKERVIDEMNLRSNDEQLKAFNIVANHLINGSTKQLLMYVSGVGGTGKSHVIKSIVSLFDQLGCRKCLLLGAPTGISAVLIGGQTLHSLIASGPNSKKTKIDSVKPLWRCAHYLVMDEVAMVGANFMSEFSNKVREAKNQYNDDISMPFGGVNVIFMGDFGQLKPPTGHSLYENSVIQSDEFRTGATLDGISSCNGILLWRQVSIVIELVKNHRQAADPTYADFLSKLRKGECTPPRRPLDFDPWKYLEPRFLDNLSANELRTFRNAPIVVGLKVVRDMLNAKLIRFHASLLNQEVALYHSVDFISRAKVSPGIRNCLWDLSSTVTTDALGRLPLFIGMKVMVTENVALGSGIVNGSEGIVSSVRYKTDTSGFRVPVVAYVHLAGCGMNIPGLEPDVVPIFPVKTYIRCRKPIKLKCGVEITSFTRSQLPLVPAYVYTDFKSQGRTLDRVIVDIATAKGQGAYVMLSRVTSLNGLAILRWFSAAQIYRRLSEELRAELHRQRLLTEQTARSM